MLAYMDVDLSTDLAALLPLVAPLLSGHSDLAIGTRLARSSRVVRGAKREIISRCYNLLLRSTLAARFTDAQCGFKAIRADAARELLPLVADTGWFFDTELLVLAQRAGLRIHEVPVDWVDDPDSRVDIVATAAADLRGVARLLTGSSTGAVPVNAIAEQLGAATAEPPGSLLRQAVRFAAVGVASTLAYVAAVQRPAHRGRCGRPPTCWRCSSPRSPTPPPTAGSLSGCAAAAGWLRHHGEGLLVFGLALAMTSSALAGLHALACHQLPVELAVLMAANLAATVIRFLLLRGLVFHPGRNAVAAA